MAMRTVPPPKSHKAGSGKTGPEPDAGSFTRMLAVETVPECGLDIDVRASEAECAALAETCGLTAVHDLEAGFHVRKLDGAKVKVTGSLRARVTQICVVSLEPFETVVRADIDVDFAPLGQLARSKITSGGGPAAAFHGGEDPPDPIVDGKIDLGALATEFLVLNLDFYPRKPGVSFEGTGVRSDPADKNSHFAVLRQRS
jgi:Large ribosomal RNA subunit accumulation protein YceD